MQEALTEVKREVVAKVEQPAPVIPKATFSAVEAGSGELLSVKVQWTFINTTTEEVQVLDEQPAEIQLQLESGEYEVFATAGQNSGEAKIKLAGEAGERFQVQAGSPAGSGPFDAPGSVVAGTVMQFGWRGPDAPRTAARGTVIEFPWSGPDAPGDMLFIAEPNMQENKYYLSDRQRHVTAKGSPAVLTVPAKPGVYEIRYYSRNNAGVLAKRAYSALKHIPKLH